MRHWCEAGTVCRNANNRHHSNTSTAAGVKNTVLIFQLNQLDHCFLDWLLVMMQCYSSLIEPAIVLLLEATIAESSMFDEYDQVLMIKKNK